WTIVKDKLGDIVAWFQELPGKIGEFLSDLPGKLKEKGTQALEDLAFAVGFGVGKVLRFFIDLPGRIVDFIKELPGKLRERATEAGESFREKIVEKFEEILAFVRTLPGKIADFIRELPGKFVERVNEIRQRLLDLGKDIVFGIIDGIKNAIGGVGSALLGGLRSARDGVKRGLGIASPSKVYMEVGEDTIAGYIAGVQAKAREATVATTMALSPVAAPSASSVAPAPQRFTVDAGDELVSKLMDRIRDV